MTLFKNIKFILPALLIAITLSSNAQTDGCSTNAAAEITVNSSCVNSAFYINTSTDYWNGAIGCWAFDDPDGWMWFTATSTSTIITLDNFNVDPILHLFEGSCSTGMNPLACTDNSSGVATIHYPTIIGLVYYVRIQDAWGATSLLDGDICVYNSNDSPPDANGDCSTAVDVCTDLNFSIYPAGTGVVTDIPNIGGVSNPLGNPGGSGNDGCSWVGEKYSTFFLVNIAANGGGSLEFTFGGLGTQAGYYDWIMYEYTATTCTDIAADNQAPVRCNWNGVATGGTGLASTLPAGGDASNYEPPLTVVDGSVYLIYFSNYDAISTEVPLEFGGTADVSCTPLPVELINFNVKKQQASNGEVARLQWSTLSEINNDYFTIERSNYGINFKEIATITGQGNSNTLHNYSFIDDTPLIGNSYYRLKQTDFDGKFIYSKTITVNIERNNEIIIVPNPSNGQFKIVGKGIQTVRIINTNGIVIYNGIVKEFDLRNYPKGMYILEGTTKNAIIRKKIIIK